MDVDVALSEVPVNIMPLIDDTDFKTVEDAVAYNAAGMDLRWNFVTSAGSFTSTAVTPTTAGTYDWTHQGDGIYTIEIPASGGASINNDTEGYGWFSGKVTGVLPFRGPIIGFRAAAINDALCDGGDLLDVNVTQLLGTAWLTPAVAGTPDVNVKQISGDATAADNAESFFDGTGYAGTNNVIPTVTTLTGHTPQTGDSFARIGATGSGLTSLAQASIWTSTRGGHVDLIPNISTSVVFKTGTVNDASATTTSFVTDLTSSVDDFYVDALLVFTGAASPLLGQSRPILSYNGTTKAVTVSEAFTSAPANGTAFSIKVDHIHPVTQIASGVRTELATELARIDVATSSRSTVTTAQVNAEVLDVIGTDTLVAGVTVKEALRRIGAITSGKVTDAGTGSETFKDFAESAATIVVVVDSSGNRTSVTYN